MTAATAPVLTPHLVVFALAGQRYAVPLERVERVAPMVELTNLPQAPAIVLGVFSLHGEIVPVVNVRRRFRLPERAPTIDDQLLVVRTARRVIAMLVDRVDQVVVLRDAAVASPATVVPGLEFLSGIVQLPEAGIVLIQDVDAFLALDEDAQLAAALEGRR